jgi:hypothetical protein
MVLPPVEKGSQRIKPTIQVFDLDIQEEIGRQWLVPWHPDFVRQAAEFNNPSLHRPVDSS